MSTVHEKKEKISALISGRARFKSQLCQMTTSHLPLCIYFLSLKINVLICKKEEIIEIQSYCEEKADASKATEQSLKHS